MVRSAGERVGGAREAGSGGRPAAPARSRPEGGGAPAPFVFANVAIDPPAPSPREALPVSEPGDAHEREADRVADAVMRVHAPPAITPAPARVHRQCDACEDEVRRKETGESAPAAHHGTLATTASSR